MINNFVAATEELFPVLGATEFFTDMHRILKIVALGNVRTLCHHRLRLLEQVLRSIYVYRIEA